MNKSFNARLCLKKDTHENWVANDPVLLNGELILVDDDGVIRYKVGDGSSTYTALEFLVNFITEDDIDAMFAGTYS